MATAARARWSAKHDPGTCSVELGGIQGFSGLFQEKNPHGHPTPQGLLDAALAASTALRLARYIGRARFEVRELELEVTHAFTSVGLVVTLAIHVVGHLSDDQQQRLLQVANGSAIHKVLAGKIAVVTLEHLQRDNR